MKRSGAGALIAIVLLALIAAPAFSAAASPPAGRGFGQWTFAEGCTGMNQDGSYFMTFIDLVNVPEGPAPPTAAEVEITYYTPSAKIAGPHVTVQPNSRATIDVSATVPNNWDVSTLVDVKDGMVSAEREMYWVTGRHAGAPYCRAQSASIGTKVPTNFCYIAEGSTGGDETGRFETWILLLNASDAENDVELTFTTPTTQIPGPGLKMKPWQRRSINVADYVPNQWSISTEVLGTERVAAERSMYWDTPGTRFQTCTNTIPPQGSSDGWCFGEGSTGGDETGNFETWILVQNPTDDPVTIEMDFATPKGAVPGPSAVVMAPHTRRTFNVADYVPNEWSVSTTVGCSSGRVVAERSMYWNSPVMHRQAGQASLGSDEDGTAWEIAGGRTDAGYESWILVMSTGDIYDDVMIEYFTESGQTFFQDLGKFPEGTRKTARVNDIVDGHRSVGAKVFGPQSPGLVVEHSVYYSPGTTPTLKRVSTGGTLCEFGQ